MHEQIEDEDEEQMKSISSDGDWLGYLGVRFMRQKLG